MSSSGEKQTGSSCNGEPSEAELLEQESSAIASWTSSAFSGFLGLFQTHQQQQPGSESITSPEEEKKQWDAAMMSLFGGRDADDVSSPSSPASKSSIIRVNRSASIQHVRQRESWDCGIACLQMAVQWMRVSSPSSIDREWMLACADTKSIWTIDLVLILQEIIDAIMNNTSSEAYCDYLFCSQTLSVNESLSGFRYYQGAFQRDKLRVAEKFRQAQERKLPMLQTATQLDLQSIVNCIRHPNCIAIALVDNHKLKQALACSSSSVAAAGAAYTGHYILLAGISDDPNHMRLASGVVDDDTETTIGAPTTTTTTQYEFCLVAHNPGVDENVSYYTLEHFERAWRAQGTDEDIIFLVAKKSEQPPPPT